MENETVMSDEMANEQPLVDTPLEEVSNDAQEVETPAESAAAPVEEVETPEAIQKRLWRESRKQKQEIKALREELAKFQAPPQQRFNINDTINHKVDPLTGENLNPDVKRVVLQTLQELTTAQEKARKAAIEQEVNKTFEVQIERAADKYEDFDDVVIRDHSLPLTPVMLECAKGSPKGADMLYELAKNHRTELDRIARLPERQQVREMYLWEAKMTNVMNKKLTSSAPAPASKLPTGDVQVANDDYAEMKKRNEAAKQARREQKRR